MHIPAIFYQQQDQTKFLLTEVPSGTFIPEELLANNPRCWLNEARVKQNTPKTLIIADWSTRPSWLFDAIFTELLKKGFTLLAYYQGNIIPFDKTITNIKIEDLLCLEHPDFVYELALKKYPLSKDALHVLDHYWMEVLLGGERNDDKTALRLSDYLKLEPKEQTKLIKTIKHLPYPLTAIIEDEYSPQAMHALAQLEPQFPGVTLTCEFQKMVIKLPQLYELMTKGYIIQKDKKLELALFDDVQELEINDTDSNLVSKEMLDYLIYSVFIHIPVINFGSQSENIIATSLMANGLKKLKKATLYGITDNTDPIQSLFEAAPYLDCLEIEQSAMTNSDFFLKKGSLKYLKKLLFNNNTFVNTYTLQQYIGATEILKELGVCSLDDEFTMNIKSGSLSKLETLSIQDSCLKPATLRTLIQATDKLLHLKLEEIIPLDHSDTNLELKALTQLQSLSLISPFATVVNVNQILLESTQLHTLILSNPKASFGNITLPPKSRPALRILRLDDLNYECAEIEKIIHAPCELFELTLQNIELKVGIRFDLVNFSAMKKFSICNISYFKSADVEIALENGLMLESLVLQYVFLEDNINVLNYRLKYLHEIILDNVCLHQKDLFAIIQSTSCLKVLKIIETNYRDSIFTLPGRVFENLEELDIPLSEAPSLLTNIDKLPKINRIRFQHVKYSDTQLDSYNNAIMKIRALYPSINIQFNNAIQKPLSPTLHITDEYLNNKPYSSEFEFEFSGRNTSKHQNMIIEKLSQYLTISGKEVQHIPKLQHGICNALSFLCKDMELAQWEIFINDIAHWTGQKSTLNDSLIEHFTKLMEYVHTYQIQRRTISRQLIGDKVLAYLETHKMDCVLLNPWHTIALKYKAEANSWYIYDPNYTSGGIEIQATDTTALEQTIQTSLGKLVAMCTEEELTPLLDNCEQFISEGGLLSLCASGNINSLLNQLPRKYDYPLPALKGLFLRNNKGIPSWVRCLLNANHNLHNLVLELLLVFCQKNNGASLELQKSMEHLSGYDKYRLSAQLLYHKSSTTLDKPTQELIDNLIECTCKAPEYIDYGKQLETWRKSKRTNNTLLEYLQECLQMNDIKKRLIECETNAQSDSLHYALEQFCINTNRPFFYIDSPKHILCSSAYIHRIGKNGLIKKGPGGLLHEFLVKHAHEAPVLIINYNTFQSDDVVRYNDLLNPERRADDTPIPEQAIVIGIRNKNNLHNYNGADFHSRLDLVEDCPILSEQLKHYVNNIPISTTQASGDTPVINLFHSSNWKTHLLGGWVLKGDGGLRFKEGPLIKALKKSNTITIANGLWDEADFRNFWQEAYLRGYIDYAGERIPVRRDIQIIKSEGYHWQAYKDYITLTDKSTGAIALNPQLLSRFLQDQRCDNTTKILEQIPGIIAAHNATRRGGGYKRKAVEDPLWLSVFLTQSLNQDEWAILLDECQTYEVYLQVQCAPDVLLPNELLDVLSYQKSHIPYSMINSPSQDLCIISTDADTSIAMLTKDEEWLVVDVSELSSSDLLMHLHGMLNNETLRFEFTNTPGFLLQSLSAGKKIVLKGDFSSELAAQLAPLFFERQSSRNTVSGQLVLVTTQLQSFSYLPYLNHRVTKEEKITFLNPISMEILSQLEPYLATESLSTLKTRRDFLQHNPSMSNSDTAWEGMYTLGKSYCSLEPLNCETSPIEAAAFLERRLKSILARFSYAPYVFLAGLSGVGKSTFVLKELKQHCTLFQGANALRLWAESSAAGLQVLFIDEATLQADNFTAFECLYHSPSVILIDKKPYTLSANHKVIFAGNPLSYGDRKLAQFFIRHGNSIVFEVNPTSLIYEAILKPIFTNTKLEALAPMLCTYFLEVYRFLVECSVDELLISPRELEMMAILTIAFCHRNSHQQPQEVAAHYAYILAIPLVPIEHLNQFDNIFKPQNDKVTYRVKSDSNFLITSSRIPLVNQLEDLFYLHHLRQSGYGSDSFKYGGTGGLLINGDPGIGKTELIINRLIAHGFYEIKDYSIPALDKWGFYKIAASVPIAEKKALLCKACDEGAIVILDEINSAPVNEALLNDLLMWKIPNKGRPKNPDFRVIAMQNPSSMGGRRKLSTAINRRMMHCELPPNSKEEICAILEYKGIPKTQSVLMVEAYEGNVHKARAKNLKPVPCFRDLLRLASQIIKGKSEPSPAEENATTTSNTMYDHNRNLLFKAHNPSTPSNKNQDTPTNNP